MAINNMTYQNGKIYCIRNTIDDDIYVGSTTQLLCKRMAAHRVKIKIKPHYKLYLKMVEVGLDNFYIELIENYPCENKEELRKREGFFIREMGTLNSRIAGRSVGDYFIEHREKIKEYIKQYQINHKDVIQLQQKEFYNKNKAEIHDKSKIYRENNKYMINAQRSKLEICECGRQITHSSKFKHIKSKIHQQLMNELILNSSETSTD
jgi:group I intron endonuclease